MILSYVQNNVPSILRWIDPAMTSPENVNNSYALCHNIYRTVNVRHLSNQMEMDVDRQNVVTSNITNAEFKGTVYLGGIPSMILYLI